MFRIILLLFSIFISVSALAQQSLDISFSMNDFKIITNDGIAAIVTTLKERRVCGDSISPDLPYFFYRIPLQQGQDNISVSVNFTDSLLSENISMVRNPRPSIRNGKSPKQKDNRIATRSVASPLHYSGIKYQNGKGYLLLKITPFLNLSWDTNNDGDCGTVEDSINYSPSVYLSRLPVRTSKDGKSSSTKIIIQK